MARRKLVVGNWKMNMTTASANDLASAVSAANGSEVDVVVCPAFVHISAVASRLRDTPIQWGAQNVYFQPEGAYTGEISTTMLADLGCRYVILGHSERRLILGESDELVNRKLKSVLSTGLIPIVCIGETLAQRESGLTWPVIESQLSGSLASLAEDESRRIVLAYEPVWAIGTGKNATPQQAQEVHADLRKWLQNRYNAGLAAAIPILYGGSVKPDNARELMTQPDIDGALVGGASLKAGDFLAIVAQANAGSASP